MTAAPRQAQQPALFTDGQRDIHVRCPGFILHIRGDKRQGAVILTGRQVRVVFRVITHRQMGAGAGGTDRDLIDRMACTAAH